MKIEIRNRQTGKTRDLIIESHKTDAIIVTGNKKMVEHIKKMAESMECIIPEPITYYELLCPYRPSRHKEYLFDEAQLIFNYFNCARIIMDRSSIIE